MKKLSIIGLIIGALAVAVAVWYPALMWLLSDSADKTIGIIGGADGPTAIFITGIFFFNWTGILFSLGIPLILTSLFCLIFPNFVRENFSIKTTALALGISATGCLGLLCLLEIVGIVAFANPNEAPIAYPVSIIVGMLSLVLFITLFDLYCKARRSEVKIAGIVLDVFTGGIFMLFFLLVEFEIIELARNIFHLFA